jgi:hypothetical protein
MNAVEELSVPLGYRGADYVHLERWADGARSMINEHEFRLHKLEQMLSWIATHRPEAIVDYLTVKAVEERMS